MIPGNGVFPPNTPYGTVASLDLERREPARNRQRFYAILVTPTRFGSWALVREWGRLGQPGTVRETWFASEHAAVTASGSLRRRKECQGYAPSHRV